ncbi:MAG: alpha/beta hydrolase [Hyphomicrobiales bacterium]|nr:alpha/beta hydrolase [Hyphomicrobiales bacterium]
MYFRHVEDWDAAYANTVNIAGGDAYPDRWEKDAASFRQRLERDGRAELAIPYGKGERNRFALFRPAGTPRGLVVFIHGGYWMRFDESTWSHLAAGPLEAGFAVAIPTYTLCPENRISGITREIGAAIEMAASRIAGPLHLTGHSAGGHLAARMVSATSPLSEAVRSRIGNVVSISGLHDLRPLMATAMNTTLRLDEEEALSESPALLRPLHGTRIVCWTGAAERAEFLRQNALLANVWAGLGATTASVEEPDRHHYSVIEGLEDASHPLTRALLATP